MNMKKLVYAIILLVCAVSCKIDEIDRFGQERYIHFEGADGKFEYGFSFLYAEGKEEHELLIPVKYAGRKYDEDKSFAVEVVAEQTTAKECEEFVLPESIVFKGGTYDDSLRLVLKKTPRMNKEKLAIRLKLVTNDNFVAAMKNALVVDINVTNVIDRPTWWYGDVENFYLGEYSDKKFELFVKNIYAGDYGALDENSKRKYALDFKDWLNANPDQAWDGDKRITVPVIG